MKRISAGRRVDIPDWAVIIRLGRSDWRVSDLRAAADESSQLIGYIEKLSARRFEVVWMTDPLRWGYVDTFDQALTALCDGQRFAGARPQRIGATRARSKWSIGRRVRRSTVPVPRAVVIGSNLLENARDEEEAEEDKWAR